jgi:hypothetical protein
MGSGAAKHRGKRQLQAKKAAGKSGARESQDDITPSLFGVYWFP